MEILGISASLAERIGERPYDVKLASSLELAEGTGEAYAYVIYFEPGGIIGPHEAGFGQILFAVAGNGWVAGRDGQRIELAEGEAAFISRGEVHSKGGESSGVRGSDALESTRGKVTTMHAVIRAYAGNSDLADALVEHEDEVKQVIAGISGFKGYYVLKLAEGTSTVSLFENEDGAEESSRAAAAWLKENLPDMNVQAPYVTAGEVVLGF